MIRYLLDTNVVSELVVSKPNENVLAWVNTKQPEQLFISVLTLGELRFGSASLDLGKRRTRLEEWIDREVPAYFAGRMLAVSGEIAHRWGKLTADAHRKGRSLPAVDGLLLATASVHNLAIGTRNVRHFDLFGVEVLNPWSA